jgi:hypothetical protein
MRGFASIYFDSPVLRPVVELNDGRLDLHVWLGLLYIGEGSGCGVV